MKKIHFHILTIFPHIFNSYLSESILKRAQKKKLISVRVHDIRDFTINNSRPKVGSSAPNKNIKSSSGRKTVDDTPYGGGPGMVLKIEPIHRAVCSILKIPNSQLPTSKRSRKKKTRIILFSTRGKKFNSKIAKQLSKYDELIMISGRYEGIDERVAKYIADEEISIGDYILSGGELPALVVLEAVSRFIPGVLGRYESLEDVKGSYPVYTKPEVVEVISSSSRQAMNGRRNKKRKKLSVPKILLSGHHKKIEEWRKTHGSKN
jgi:tRNA (guanine37-N1)-methyltransferase